SLRKIKKIDGASGFVGTRGNEKPHPIPADEIKGILQRAGELKTNNHVMVKQTFEVGETVKIVEGPFDTFVGKIDELNLEKGKAKVMVGILGRFTPVEVELSQVEKI
ncbi:MAG: transcription termination/antitermination protein NusG, partial [Spirochaetia bacterium]|nr:transcription termination/antitermination protein NusG [Spirochaetia bacterium]